MTEHTWTREEIDGGSVGRGEFWKCSACGASGGPTLGRLKPKDHWIFLGNGSGLRLTADCNESKRLIDAFNLGVECAERWGARE